MSNPADLGAAQRLVDELAAELGRSVELDSPTFEVICASAQLGAIDERRVDSIIRRTGPPEPIPWLLEQGIREATGPVRIPANPGYGMLPRICVPVRRPGSPDVLGFLWLFDEPPLTDAELDRLGDLAARVVNLFGAPGTPAPDPEAVTAGFLAGETSAARTARETGLLPPDGPAHVHVFPVSDGAPLPDALTRRRLPRPVLARADAAELVVVECPRSPADTDATLAGVAAAGRAAGVDAEVSGSATVGAPEAAPAALRHARFAAEVAALPGHPTGREAWERAGAWRLLLGRDLSDATVPELSADAAALIAAGDHGHWRTLLAYLDHGRSTARSSAALFIHRTTLHYRLGRARDIVGDEAVDEGWRCAALHVALRLHAHLHPGSAHQ